MKYGCSSMYYGLAALHFRHAYGAAVPTDDGTLKATDDLFSRQTAPVGSTVNMPPPEKPLSSWVALGDSFSAGPGAGNSYNGDNSTCWRRDRAYAPQLAQSSLFSSGYNNPQLNFLSCSGHITTQIQDIQIPSIANTLQSTNIVALSIGNNDIGLSNVIVSCVFNKFGSCQSNIDAARATLYSTTFYNNYFSMINLLISDLTWCLPAGKGTRAEDCFTLVYQTAYPSFFESYTNQCNNVSFFSTVGSSLTQDLRTNLNQLGQEVNTMLAYFVANINYQLRQTRNTYANFMVFADQGERYAGHRFCRDGVSEPDVNNPETWFFNYRSNSDTETAVFGGTVELGFASDYSLVNATPCISTDDVGDQLACTFSQMIADGQLEGTEEVIAYTASEARSKSFHPNSNGFGATNAEIQQRLSYVSAITEGRGCPTAQGLNLRIVGIGDSITWGYGSSDGQGYFATLNQNLKGLVPGCLKNTINFVGSQLQSLNGGFLNEGYPGQTVSQIQASVQQNGVLAQRPNVILLMAGTNDTYPGRDPGATAQLLGTFIDYLFSQCPDAVILVQHIPPIGRNTFNASISTLQTNVIKYNAAVSAIIDTKIAQGQHVTKVHQTTTTFDHVDLVHPNTAGYNMIGEAWTEHITIAAQRGWIEAPVVVDEERNYSRTQCLSGLSWDYQGEVTSGVGLGANIYPGITCSTSTEDPAQCSCIDDINPNVIAYNFTLSGPSCVDMSYPNATAVHFADLDGDGRAEYLWLGPHGEIVALYNNGYIDDDSITNGSHINWVPAGAIASGVGGLRAEIRFADLNGDGRADYLWVLANGSVIAYLNGGQIPGSATPANVEWLAQGSVAGGIGKNGAGTRFADLAGLGRSDYIWVDDYGALTAYLNYGSIESSDINADHVGWQPQGIINTGIGEGRWNTQFGDIDGDGRDDYLGVSLDTGAVIEYRNTNGENGSSEVLTNIEWVFQNPFGDEFIATGAGSGLDVQFADLNGDGRVDYIFVDPKTSAVQLWLNRCSNPAVK